MLQTRVMPCLLLNGETLVKTRQFTKPTYIGDPVNAIKIYNEKEVDELILLDISATPEEREPNLDLIQEVTNECFMPLTYGGGITTIEQMQALFSLGVEKVALNSCTHKQPELISEAAKRFGNQAVIVSIDVKRRLLGGYEVVTTSARQKTGKDPVAWAMKAVELGAGELLLTSVDNEGTMEGLDEQLIAAVTDAVAVPVIAQGGAGTLAHIGAAVHAGASAVAIGSMAVFQGPNRAVLIRFPKPEELSALWEHE